MTSRFFATRRWLGNVRVRVTAAATIVGLLGAIIGSVLFVRGLHESLEAGLLSSAQQQTDSVVAQLHDGVEPTQAAVSGERDVITQILNPQRELIASDHPRVTDPVRTTPGATESVNVPALNDTYAVYAKLLDDDRLVLVGLSEEQISKAIQTTVLLLTIAVPLAIVLLALVVWLAIGRALRPVEVMRGQAAAITSEHLHHRLAVPPGDDEIPRLAATLNQMLDRIDTGQQQQQQFVSDASHELRSPLAIVRQMVEVARRHPDSTTVARLAEDIRIEEVRMEALVEALLTLARLDSRDPVRGQIIDVDDLVLNEVDRLRVAHPAITFNLSGLSAGQAHGDPVLLGHVVSNLLSNAARHAASVVRVSLQEPEDVVALSVEDDGGGIAEADRERVFERFARLDEARTRDAGGAGLGLAIVRKVVTAAGGDVEVSSSDLGGALFTVTLPRLTA